MTLAGIEKEKTAWSDNRPANSSCHTAWQLDIQAPIQMRTQIQKTLAQYDLNCEGPFICTFFPPLNACYSTTRSKGGWNHRCGTSDTGVWLQSYKGRFSTVQGFGAPDIVQESTIDLENLTLHCLEDTRLQYLCESLYLISIPIQLPPWIQKYSAPERI